MAAQSVLLVEDDPALRALTARALQQHGYRVRTAASGPEMWRVLEGGGAANVILLDVMPPGASGIDLCRKIRQTSDVPSFSSAPAATKRTESSGWRSGRMTFLPKPFGTRELVARVRAVLRRGRMEARTGGERVERIGFDGWSVDLTRREVCSPSGALVELTGAEFDLLSAFLDNAGRIVADADRRRIRSQHRRPGQPAAAKAFQSRRPRAHPYVAAAPAGLLSSAGPRPACAFNSARRRLWPHDEFVGRVRFVRTSPGPQRRDDLRKEDGSRDGVRGSACALRRSRWPLSASLLRRHARLLG